MMSAPAARASSRAWSKSSRPRIAPRPITPARRRPVAWTAAATLASRIGFCGSRANAVRCTGTPPIIWRPCSVVRPTSGMAGRTKASPTPRTSIAASISAPRGPRSPVSIFLRTMPDHPARRSASAPPTRPAASGGGSVRLCVLRTPSAPAGPAPPAAGCTTTPADHGSISAPTSQAPVRSSAMMRSACMNDNIAPVRPAADGRAPMGVGARTKSVRLPPFFLWLWRKTARAGFVGPLRRVGWRGRGRRRGRGS